MFDKNAAVFIDRDGTLIRDVGYLRSIEEIEILPGVVEGLARLRARGFKLVLVTNQSAVGRGLLTESALEGIHAELQRRVGTFDGVYYCPHHPTDALGRYRVTCDCRKPGAGMVERASRELNLDAAASYVIGDQPGDMQLARRVGAKGVFLGRIDAGAAGDAPELAAHVESFHAAVRWIVADRCGAAPRSAAAAGRGKENSKLLVVQTSFIGDVVLAQPLVAALRREFPTARLDVLCTPPVAELVRAGPHVDDVLCYDKRGDDRGVGGLYRLVQELKQRSYTLAVSPHKSFRTAWLLAAAGIPLRVGFRQSAGWFLYHRRVRRDAAEHEVLRNLSLLSALGVDPRAADPELTLAVASRQRCAAAKKLAALGVPGAGRQFVFGINPGSVWRTKRWSIEGFAALIGALKAKYACHVLIFGGPDDAAIAGAIQALSGGAAIDAAGAFTLAELPAALERCDVLISTDSAPMHMAVARGVPVVAVFCATTPSLGFYPFSSRSVVVHKDLHCRPCGSHGGRRCPLGTYACIEGIPAGAVAGAVERVLARRSVRAGCSYVPEFVTV